IRVMIATRSIMVRHLLPPIACLMALVAMPALAAPRKPSAASTQALEKIFRQRVADLKQQADGGDLEAMCDLGYAYAGRDDAQAAAWFRKAAEQKNRRGMTGLGWCLTMGIGVERDDVEAMRWLRQAADAGWGDAATLIARMHADGRGVVKDEAAAAEWQQKAGTVSGDDADRSAAEFDALTRASAEAARAAAVDRQRAQDQQRKADEASAIVDQAKGFDPAAMTKAAEIFRTGAGGFPKDEALAQTVLRLAAEAGDPGAMDELGDACAG